jgi:pilus assembly protein CpaD
MSRLPFPSVFRRSGLALAPRTLTAAAALAISLSACADREASTSSTYPRDYRERHPIVLTEASRALDVFVVGIGGLDRRQRDDVKTFAEEYRKLGSGAIVAQVPGHARADVEAQRTLDAIRSTLSANGVPGAALSVETYLPTDPSITSPIRLSYRRFEAKVSSKCGLWPQDLGVSDYTFNVRNEPYWNLGCATQSNIASQIADPIDLVRGRTEGRIDTLRRAKDIDNLRQGKDPSTQWRQDDRGKINTSVGN